MRVVVAMLVVAACKGSGAASSADASGDAIAGDGATIVDATPGDGIWVYRDGSFNWPLANDYSYAVDSIDYHDTSGGPLTGAADIKVVAQPYGGWQPAAGLPLTSTNWDQPITGMTKLTFALKPTQADQDWSVFFHKVGDILVYDSTGQGESVTVSAYGPTPQANVWGTYVVPLSAVVTDWDQNGVAGQGPPVQLVDIYKFAIADTSGANRTWFVDNVGFVP